MLKTLPGLTKTMDGVYEIAVAPYGILHILRDGKKWFCTTGDRFNPCVATTFSGILAELAPLVEAR